VAAANLENGDLGLSSTGDIVALRASIGQPKARLLYDPNNGQKSGLVGVMGAKYEIDSISACLARSGTDGAWQAGERFERRSAAPAPFGDRAR
jgi:hypothetical protein